MGTAQSCKNYDCFCFTVYKFIERSGIKNENQTKKLQKLWEYCFYLQLLRGIIGGLILYAPIKKGPDYLTKGAEHANQVILGALMELITVVAVIGTATTMFPFLRKYNETIALWHVSFRFLEAVIITVGLISVLSLVTLSRELVVAGAPDTAAFQASVRY